MKLRTKYVLFVGILHFLALAMSYFIFREDKIFFLVAEAVILFSVWMSWRLYLQLIRPLKDLAQGADAIRDRDFNVKFPVTGKHEMDVLIGVYNDMMDHLREERTRQQEQHFFLEKMIRTSPTGIVVLDFDDRVYQVNPRALLILGMEERAIAGKEIGVLEHPLTREMARLATGKSAVVSRNGMETYKIQKSHFIDRGFARHFVMIEEMTAEILAAEKRAYGKVIRMMAHEVNNTIGPVNSIMGTVLGELEGGGTAAGGGGAMDAGGALREALRIAIQRNTNLNYFMRNFADVVRLPAPDKRQVDVIGLLEDVVKLMRMQAGASRRVLVEVRGGDVRPWMLMMDQQQMEQVLINIIKNGLEAIEDAGEVRIIADPAARKLLIKDTGAGISAEAAEQLFSPFFSTKRNGQGIGLTLIREVLIGHGFVFSLKAGAEGGAEFEIRVG